MAAYYQNSFEQPVGFPVPDWKECQMPQRSSISGNWCRVEGLDNEKHTKDLFKAYLKNHDDSEWTYLRYGPFDSIDEFESWIFKASKGNDPVFYSIIDLKTEKAIGICAYLRIQPTVGVIELGNIHFSPLLKKTTMATEAMYLMMRRIFDDLNYRRCEWKCDSLNAASRNTALRLGFTFEGIFRQALVYKGRNRDTAWYSVIDNKWPILKKSFEKWLSPENFKSQGEQVKSLSEIRNNLDEKRLK